MVGWQAKKFQLPNHNFETIAIKFENGRAGLCYHGSTIWNDEGGGWEAFIASDWDMVWKEGKPCSFKELPPDMRIMCPACGAKIHPDDAECGQCGIIFDKMKDAPEEPENPEEPPVPGETRRFRFVNICLTGVGLIVAGLLLYNVFKPESPQPTPDQSTAARKTAVDTRHKQTSGQPDAYQHSGTEPASRGGDYGSSDSGDNFEEEVSIGQEDYYSYINLDDPETAHQQLMEATQALNEEALRVKDVLLTATTPDEKRQAEIEKMRYEQKAVQLSKVVRAFNARNDSDR